MKVIILYSMIASIAFFFSIFKIPRTVKHSNTESISEPKFTKLIYLVIDGLRFDAYVPVNKSGYYYNNISFANNPERLKTTYFSVSGIPTATTCRIISMMTGSSSNQIEEIMTFYISKTSIEALPDKFKDRKMFHYGDSMWPEAFPVLKTKSHNYCGLGKEKLVENEENMIKKVLEDKEHDIKFVHAIALDAFGHIYGTEHQIIKDSLLRMDRFLHALYDGMDDETLLVVTSDHGVTDDGSHGGNSKHELASFCGIYSKVPVALQNRDFSWYNEKFLQKFYDCKIFNAADDWTKSEHPYKVVHQDDILPTISYLMGVPIPANTYGSFIPFMIDDAKASRSFAEQKKLLANIKNVPKDFKTLEDEHYFLTNLIYDNAVDSNPLFLLLAIPFALASLIGAFLFSNTKLYLLCKNIPFFLSTIMVTHSYFAFASEDIIWIFTFLLTNFSVPNLLFSIYFLKTPGRNFFSRDRFNIRMEAFKSNAAMCFVVLLFFVSKNMTFSRKRFISGQESTRIFYKNSHFMKNINRSLLHFSVLLYSYFHPLNRQEKIAFLILNPSLDTLLCIHFSPVIALTLLYFLKNIDVFDSQSLKFVLLSAVPYFINHEKVFQSIDYNIPFVLDDRFKSLSNVLGVFTYAFIPRLIVHMHFKVESCGMFLHLFSLYLCFAVSYIMKGSLVFQYFFVGRLLFIMAFFIIDVTIEQILSLLRSPDLNWQSIFTFIYNKAYALDHHPDTMSLA